ncbi:hypothetical protein BKA60DRAFT_457273 [Fusarium oxysporum]|uniref:Uncharacterized protein n=1 Tax=Fusarium oxysporum TaxID=5507 RepID=A0A420P772_FUSOX|nr:hypothetical protein BKA60DRAFT_457273 [Fusarium oxysporum]RKK88371.1 hypothetical protein BFJ69_g227 [Fusarium oxysporum]
MLDDTVDLVTIDVLGTRHRQAFVQALMRVMETDVAERTFAEIIDGLPTIDSYQEFHWPQDGHPATQHLDVCPGTIEKARQLRCNLPSRMSFHLPLLCAFEEATIDSRPFYLRLFELLAVSIHQIAVYLYQQDGANHTHQDYQKWIDSPRDTSQWDGYRHPTAFCHTFYIAVERYPNGVADTVGYWAEAKIFGGVFVFNRGESESECNELYLHAGRRAGPFTLFPLTTKQFERLVDFLLGETEEPAASRSPLPFTATSENRWRWHTWDAMARYHIFRDKYERSVQPTKPTGCVKSAVDWPEIADELYLIGAMHDYWNGQPIDKSKVRTALELLQQITPSSPVWPNRNAHSWTKDLLE